MANTVISANMLTAGLRSEFADTYLKQKRASDTRVSDVMLTDVPSDKLTEIYGYFESAPHMRRWVRGKGIPSKPFASKQFSVTNKDWGQRVEWHRNDRMDDQTGTLFEAAQAAGRSAGALDERILFQIMTAASDFDLLESIPNAPDGVALFSTVDGDGAARFGATNGNLLSGSGVATGSAIRTDLWSVIAQARLYQGTEGQPLFDDAMLDAGVTIMYGAANEEVFREAFVQELTAFIRTGASTSDTGGVAAVTNTVLASGMPITLWPTQRITDNDWFVAFKGAPKKAIFSQNREALQEEFATMENSDSARETGIEYGQWHLRKGYGVALPYGLIKVNN